MRISRRTSGGRGEFEISEHSDNGLTPNDLLDRQVNLRLGAWQIDTETRLTSQGGKRRLRRINKTGKENMQVPRQVAAALMLPSPVREDKALGSGEPVVQRNRYAIEHIHVDQASLPNPSAAILDVTSLTLRNAMVSAETLDVPARVTAVETVWTRATEFPKPIADAILEHQAAVKSGGPILGVTETLVARLQVLVSEHSSDLGVIYTQQLDFVPPLLAALNAEVPEPTITVDEIDPDEIQVRERNIKEWKGWANIRGPKSAVFRQDVREAYRSTCVVCGYCYPATDVSAAGVDAAHILPWSKYDLDEVINGLCLCKLDHHFFDEGLLRIIHVSGKYFVEIPPGVEERLKSAPTFSISVLKGRVGEIPQSRLPGDKNLWPRPQLLDKLNAAMENPSS